MAESPEAYVKFTALLDADGQPSSDQIASLVLHRPEAANAFSGELLVELTRLLQDLATRPTVRLMLLQGEGKHFSAGADLRWMQQAAQLDYEGNQREAEKLTLMFETLANLPMPTMALVRGAAFGGAVGLVAACDYAWAYPSARFCLSETKIGLLPAVILPYLARKIPAGALHRQVLTARVFSAAEAESLGLVQRVLYPEDMEAQLQEEVLALLAASPNAQAAYKVLYRQLATSHWQQDPATVAAIASMRASASGQAGLQAFFQKQAPPWSRRLAPGVKLLCP